MSRSTDPAPGWKAWVALTVRACATFPWTPAFPVLLRRGETGAVRIDVPWEASEWMVEVEIALALRGFGSRAARELTLWQALQGAPRYGLEGLRLLALTPGGWDGFAATLVSP